MALTYRIGMRDVQTGIFFFIILGFIAYKITVF